MDSQSILNIASVLFDSGASHSFIKEEYAALNQFEIHKLQPPYQIQSPGSVFQTDQVCRDVKMEIQRGNFSANLIVITSVGIGVILGMDWLSKNQGKIDCAQRSISVTSEDDSQVVFAPLVGDSHLYALEAGTLLELDKVPVVCEYPDVFPEELPGMPPDREVEFVIELAPGTAPISKRPYRMPPNELVELKEQLKETSR